MTTLETTGRPTREALEQEREALTRERGRLLVDDPTGERLGVVRARLDAIAEQLQDLVLADEERQRRAADADAAHQTQRVRQAQVRAAGLLADSQAEVAEAEALLDRGVTRLRGSMALRRDAYRELAAVGQAPARGWLAEDAVRGALAWKLQDLLGGHAGYVRRPPVAYRRSLTELLVQADAVGHPAAAVEATAASPTEEARG